MGALSGLSAIELQRIADAVAPVATPVAPRSASMPSVIIAADVLPRVFEPHFSTRTSGSGLGLAISKRLVDAWGGSIQIGPATPRGTDAVVGGR